MRGKLSETPVADVARRLSNDDVTGALEVNGAAGVARVFFRTGDVYWAMSPAPRARLGDRLVNAGFISQEQLERTLEAQQQAEERTKLGALLVDEGLVTRDVIRVFVQEQILDALFDLVRWDQGDWVFHPGDAVEDKLPIDIPVPQLLVEASRRQNEWDQIQRTIPTLDAVPDHVIGGNATTAALEQDEFTMLASIDGDRSVRELASDLGYSEFEAARIVYGLTLLGIVEIVGDEDAEPATPAAEAPAEPEVEHADLEAEPEDEVDRQQQLDDALADVLDATGPDAGAGPAAVPTSESDDDIDVGEALEQALFGDPDPEPEPPAVVAPEPEPAPAARDDGGLQVTVHFSLDDGVAEPSAHARPAPAAPTAEPTPAPAAPATPDEPEPWVFTTGDDPADESPAVAPAPQPAAPAAPAASSNDPDLDGFDDFFAGPPSDVSAEPSGGDDHVATPEPSTAEIAEDLDALVADIAGTDEPATEAPAATPAAEPEAAPASRSSSGRGDVSEFLRELTQLNVEDEGGGSPDEDDEPSDDAAPTAPSRREPAGDDKRDDKKKKGLFGWGR